MAKYAYGTFPPEKIVQAFTLHRLGADYKEIGEKVGISPAYAASIIHQVSYKLEGLEGEVEIKRMAPNWQKAMDVLRKQYGKNDGKNGKNGKKEEPQNAEPKLSPPITPVPVDLPVDLYETLENSFQSFMTTVEKFIVFQVDKRVGEIKEENKVLKKTLEEGKIPNWIRHLKKRFEV